MAAATIPDGGGRATNDGCRSRDGTFAAGALGPSDPGDRDPGIRRASDSPSHVAGPPTSVRVNGRSAEDGEDGMDDRGGFGDRRQPRGHRFDH